MDSLADDVRWTVIGDIAVVTHVYEGKRAVVTTLMRPPPRFKQFADQYSAGHPDRGRRGRGRDRGAGPGDNEVLGKLYNQTYATSVG